MFDNYNPTISILVIYIINKSMECNMNVLEYLCLDNENNFRSKIIFSNNNIEDIQPIITRLY
jgi:hypothetical protein